MEHQPPPFFKRGPAPLAQLSFYAMISLALVFVDSRFQTLELLRQAISVFTHPIQEIVQSPVNTAKDAFAYFSRLSLLEEENVRMKHTQLVNAETLLRTQQLEAENERLRKLLNVRHQRKINGRVAQVIYTPRDPFSLRVVVDKGQQDNIEPGLPVVDDAGVVGQVTRVFPFVSEITLITDKEQAVPVQVLRTGMRSVVFGLGDGRLEMRYLPVNADIQENDTLITSGLDGIFPSGLPVARVVHVERDTAYSLDRVYCTPLGAVENFGEIMVLDAQESLQIPSQLTAPSGNEHSSPRTDTRNRSSRK